MRGDTGARPRGTPAWKRPDQPLMHSPMKALRLAPRSDCSVAARLQASALPCPRSRPFCAEPAVGATASVVAALAALASPRCDRRRIWPAGTIAGAATALQPGAGYRREARAGAAPGALAAAVSCLPLRCRCHEGLARIAPERLRLRFGIATLHAFVLGLPMPARGQRREHRERRRWRREFAS